MMLSRRILRGRSCLCYLTSATSKTVVATELKPPVFTQFSTSSKSKFDFSYKLNNLYTIKGHYFSTNALESQPVNGIVDIPLAQTGEGIAECELLKWFVQEGDQVEEYQRLCEVQSDKATIEITSRYNGKVAKVLHIPGDMIKVGETLLKLLVDDSSLAHDGAESSLGSDTPDSDDNKAGVKKSQKGEALCTPAVRSLAKEHNIDINDVTGTGKHGRISKEDVLKYALEKGIIDDKPALFNPGSIEPMEGPEEKLHEIADSLYHDKILTLRAYQRAMVKSMTAAASVPHFHYVEEINCDSLIELKSAFQKENTDPEVKFTFLPVLIKALSMALTTHPLVNSTFNLETYEVTLKGSHNIGIAMATPSGLVVPNIKNVQSLSIFEIAKELSRLQKLAMANKLPPADISGGTITLSNIGSIGGKFGSPLINVPEVAIIALGKIQKVAHFADDGTVYPVSLMTVNIAADHRILDGANVAFFCKEWKEYIEKPELLLLRTR
ncbi:putative dihydrolipoyllysine-residue (2-methylpropanoyl)transferase [Helianthus annuus]|uniref:Dihydrolipoamide acetyltransferase component of pyruvate dehydrogenase complex n=1 Tax=Helianthus annuus TaxID=4232 RepID=A0A251RQG9_HELAN|nr:lipoamide acyltransferase component of branched-chain alpha-keto acid dehydrogenase complex, mitochondrial [Helianthus annuus]KAF5753612.1 putative dihydrolipoyllysine-residue (2-methylpropanoyl)transferase [Helianthus annuus]KAJ0427680.1 putative dihydrolipoyllysine-residue (2-methylpropanoyl)transferase [Helianthus annuus]KAJ0431514.1 putative dihydrolipoyllysine-residue (2-methylpropanoyl)transferase [Helianthus annuus]KAJ0445967.1 putative dihydrolipoyllysine-residue (2-methylpropanoyl)t